MNKCKKCGTEFEGKFCPECGTPWLAEGEKLCPKCKAVLKASAKFCSECGYSFETRSAPAPAPKPAPTPTPTPPKKIRKQLTAGVRKLYAAVSLLPAVLLGAFSVLMFLFFLAPVAVMPGGEMLGQKIPSMSYGNVYAGSNYAGMSFAGSIKALIVFAAFALFVSFLILISCVFSNLRDKRYTIFGKAVFLRSLLTTIGYALFFLLFLISCILMGQIASAGGGLGMMKAGAAPILVLVFTLICSLAALACTIVGVYLRKAYPALVAETEKRVAAGKPTKVEVWINKRKKLVTIVSLVLVVGIVVSIAVPVGLANRHNGTYYAYNGETEEYDRTIYYKLKGNSWVNENGEKGKISFDGEKVTLTYDPSNGMDKTGSSVITSEGTIKGGVLKVDGTVFAKEGHEHTKDVCICACGRWSLNVSLNEDGSYTIIGIGSFNGKNLTIPDNVTSIGDAAFRGCSRLNSVTLPDSVTGIGGYAFFGCGELTSVTIGSGVLSIGDSAFEDCKKLTKVNITDLATWCGIDFVNEGANPLINAPHLYINGVEATKLEFSAEISEIKENAFFGYSGLTSVVIGSGVKLIDNAAFSGCNGLEHIEVAAGNTIYRSENDCLIEIQTNTLILGCKNSTIPDSVTSIGQSAFAGCSGLTGELKIPNSVTSIGSSAFEDCSGLTSVTIPNSVISIESCAFNGCTNLANIVIPDSVISIWGGMYWWDGAFGGTAYDNNAMNWDASGVLYIGNHLIQANENSISGAYTIRAGTKTIAGGAFAFCRELTSITIPGSVTEIGQEAFYRCTDLTSIIIPDNVTSIEDGVFIDCGSLKSVTIGSGMTSIGEDAFWYCSELTDIQFKGTVKEWQAIKKGNNWNSKTGNYTVTCTDGKIAKDGTVTYFEN